MKQYIVDAFTDRPFHGNPAAICVLEQWPSVDWMLCVTRENNLSETAFAVKEGERYRLRWFTPGGEIDLCGHATLACAFVLMREYEPETDSVLFDTLGGELSVRRRGDLYEMDFPAYALRPAEVTEQISAALGVTPLEVFMGRDLLCVLEDEAAVRGLRPDLQKVRELDGLLLHVTARGSRTDCVSRSFAPKCGVAEDPVCGSGHCHIAPYWAGRLQKTSLVAEQASARGGTLYCQVRGDRVTLAGNAALYSVAQVFAQEA